MITTTYTCDKCGKKTNDKDKFATITSSKYYATSDLTRSAENQWDLCERCYNRFVEVFIGNHNEIGQGVL